MKDIELPPRVIAKDHPKHPAEGWSLAEMAWINSRDDQFLAYARAAVEADRAQRVPDGLALVPIEPTRSMVDAAERIDWGDSDVRGNIYNMWNVLLASTPAQPAPQPVERKPMTREQVKGLMESAGYDLAKPQEQADFISGIRHAELHHGIRE